VTLLLVVGCKEQIVHDLTEQEVNRYLTRLNELRIEGDRVRQSDGRWALAVDGDDRMRAIKALDESRLLRSGNSAPLEKSSVINSREDQRFRVERALAREIENTLTSIDGVLEARVHLNMAPTDPLFGTPVKGGTSSGSVLVVVRDGFSLPGPEIAALVAGASGIDRSTISVLINRTAKDEPHDVPVGDEVSKPLETAALVMQETMGVSDSGQPTLESQIALAPTKSIWRKLSSAMGLQIIASLLIIVGGGALMWRNRRARAKSSKSADLSGPLLKP